MATYNKNYGLFGFGIQDSIGTAADSPIVSFYASGDSQGIHADQSNETLKLTKGSPVDVATYKSEISPNFSATTLCFPDLTAALLYAALGDLVTTEGTDTYSHTITAGESIPYITVFEQKGSSTAELASMQDAKVDSVTITAEGVAPISLDTTINGCTVKWHTDTTDWTGPAFSIDDGYYSLADAEVLFSLSDSEPTDVPAGVNLSKLELGIENSVESQSILGSAVPGDQTEGGSVITASLEGTTSDISLYREVMTGAADGTEIASTVVTGSLQMTFSHSSNSDYSLVLKVPAIPWTIDAFNVSTDGGPFDLKLSTDGALDAGDGSVEIIVTNGTASYGVGTTDSNTDEE